MTGDTMLKGITTKMSKICKEIADYIKDRWNVQEEDLEAQPMVEYFDSLDRVELAMELEKRYEITIMEDEPNDWAWFSDVVRCVYNKVTGK